ncbi:nicotinamide-nucleotide adenylyltransferase [archaeon]|nr:nicotinamide-nucleotide adenylyltransferase [archaeon]
MEVRGFYIGRFQPVHNGHVYCIRYVLERCHEVVIGIGSAQYSHTLDNPFTAGERMEMLYHVVRDLKAFDKVFIVPIPDLHVHSLWVAHVLSLTPRFQEVYTNDPLTQRLFLEAGFTVHEIPPLNRSVLSGTEVRKRMIEGKDWRSLVPPYIANYIDHIRGVERLRDIARRMCFK